MTSFTPLFRIRRDRFEVLQGNSYVVLDRSQVNAVYFRSPVLTVCYKERGEVTLDCTKVEPDELKRLVHRLQLERDRNLQMERGREKKDSGSILPSHF